MINLFHFNLPALFFSFHSEDMLVQQTVLWLPLVAQSAQ